MGVRDPYIRDHLIEQLRAEKKKLPRRRLPVGLVNQYAAVLGCDPRHVRRLVSQRPASAAQRKRLQLTDELYQAYFDCHGVVTKVRERMTALGVELPTDRTLQRMFRRELSEGERAFARNGEEARRKHSVYSLYEVGERNELWIGDGKELDTLAVVTGSGTPIKPWTFSLFDARTRACMGLVLTPTPNARDFIAALRDAVTLNPARGPFHGTPTALQLDNALAHLSNDVEEACLALDIGFRGIPPYSAYLNGKIERWHKTLKDEFSAALPFFTHAPKGADGEPMWPTDGRPIHVDLLRERLVEWVDSYNRQRPHSSLGGRTPEQAWLDQATPIREADPEIVRRLALPDVERKVSHKGIGFRNGYYVAGELNALHGEMVTARYSPNDESFVEVFYESTWLCTARRTTYMTHVERGDVAAQRKRDQKRADQAMQRRLMREKERADELAELLALRPGSDGKPDAPGTPSPVATHAKNGMREPAKPGPSGRRPRGTDLDHLAAFGLNEELNQAVIDTKEERHA